MKMIKGELDKEWASSSRNAFQLLHCTNVYLIISKTNGYLHVDERKEYGNGSNCIRASEVEDKCINHA